MTGRNAIWVCIVVIIATMFYRITPMVAEQDSVYRTYAPLVEVDALIQRWYVQPPRDRRLLDGAIRGMLRDLDPYSGYVSPDEMDDFLHRNRGRYTGIGLELGIANGHITVIAPLDGGPAENAGIQPGDLLLAVDQLLTEDLSVFDVEGLLTGDPGSTVEIRLRHPTTSRETTLEITRDSVDRTAVRGFRRRTHARAADGEWDHMIDPRRRIAYIRVARFGEGMIDDFDTALQDVTQRRAAALIIDLRSNPGGVMHQAIALADRFLDHGIILTTVTRRQAVDTYTATPQNTVTHLPLAILIDAGSASSAEIVAGALQDHHRALIVGERSFGKGTVQNFFELGDGLAGIKLTVAHYRLPAGRIIHKTPQNAPTDQWGVTPDIIVPFDQRPTEPPSTHSPPPDPQLQAALIALAENL